MTLIGKPQLPANTYRDFENYIRANAGKLNIAHAGLGSASHLCGLMWQSAIKASEAMTTIPYGGTAPAMNALLGGQVDLMCDQTTNTTQQIASGRVKAFAVTTAKPLSKHKLLKDYPTLQEMGLKGFDLTIWHGLYAPKGTPPAVLKKVNDALKLALKDPDFLKKQDDLGAVVVTDNRMEPAAHKAFVAAALAEVGPDQSFPLRTDPLRRLGVAITGQIDKIPALGKRKIVEVLRATRRLADVGQPHPSRQGVDRRRLAGIGTAGKGDLADGIPRQVAKMGDGGEKNRLLEQGHKKLSGAAKAAEK